MLVNRLLKAGAKVSLTKGDAPLALVNTKPEIWKKAIEGFDVRSATPAEVKPPALATSDRGKGEPHQGRCAARAGQHEAGDLEEGHRGLRRQTPHACRSQASRACHH